MKPKDDQLAVLHRLRNEGQLSEPEYERLSGGLSSSNARIAAQDDPNRENLVREEPEADLVSVDPSPEQLVRADLSTKDIGVIGLASFALITASSLGMVSWLFTIPAIVVLATALIEGWAKVTKGSAVAAAVILVVSFVMPTAESTTVEPTVVVTLPPTDPQPQTAGSSASTWTRSPTRGTRSTHHRRSQRA